VMPTAALLLQCEAECRTLLLVTIRGFYHGRPGCYHGTDTSRKEVLRSRVLP
jgi:hypothetical protein